MREIRATEVKTRLDKLLWTVDSGETAAITRHGNTDPHLVPARGEDAPAGKSRF